MDKIARAFENKKALIAFITGGDPDIKTTERLIPAMAKAGADIIEIGIPFSDPVAEGPVIQRADERALKSGVTLEKLFEMVKRVREKMDIPLLFMTYANPVFYYGKDSFMQMCKTCGIDGVILPDLPFEEKDELQSACTENGITLISMIAPTSKSRIPRIAKDAEGFLYCVSSLGVTGVREKFSDELSEMIDSVRSVSGIPCAVGFGISKPEQARSVAKAADGVIIGSAIVKIIEKYGKKSENEVVKYIKNIKKAITF